MFNVPESSAGSRVEQQVDDTIMVKKMCVILGADNAQIITRVRLQESGVKAFPTD